jgi:hypothetical protein
MRTTLQIDNDVLQASKELAKALHTTAGQVLSDLAREGIRARSTPSPSDHRSGVPLLPSRGRIVTSQQVQEIIDEEGI